MGKRYLIDTCAVIKYLDEIFPPEALIFMDKLLDEESIISFVTKIELLVWKPPIPEDIKIRKEFINGSNVHYINDEIIDKAIEIRNETKIKLPDAIIASTAINYDLILISDNDKDFKKVVAHGLNYMNPKIAFS